MVVTPPPACYGLEVPRSSANSPLTTWVNDLVGHLLDAPQRSPEDPPIRNPGRVKEKVEAALDLLTALAHDLDPIKKPTQTFNPSDPAVVGPFIAMAMLAQPLKPMAEINQVPKFYGSGIYAIYYHGDFDAYGPISGSEHPIYVGKADPEDPKADTPQRQGTRLFDRVKEHSKTIRKATSTLRIEDFDCRYLVITSGWQDSAEKFLIRLFEPVWNSQTGICYGIGKHGDSNDTRANGRSPWDTMHPGRSWAEVSTPGDQFPESEIRANLAVHFMAKPPLRTQQDALTRFFDTLR